MFRYAHPASRVTVTADRTRVMLSKVNVTEMTLPALSGDDQVTGDVHATRPPPHITSANLSVEAEDVEVRQRHRRRPGRHRPRAGHLHELGHRRVERHRRLWPRRS